MALAVSHTSLNTIQTVKKSAPATVKAIDAKILTITPVPF
jgi:hypothetical protein